MDCRSSLLFVCLLVFFGEFNGKLFFGRDYEFRKLTFFLLANVGAVLLKFSEGLI